MIGNVTQILPVLQWLEVVIAFVYSSNFIYKALFWHLNTKIAMKVAYPMGNKAHQFQGQKVKCQGHQAN